MNQNPRLVRSHRPEREGEVVSDAMDKTRVVMVTRRLRHPRYKKVVTQRARLYAHDEANTSHRGDWVRVVATRPLSRLKRWRVISIIRRAKTELAEET